MKQYLDSNGNISDNFVNDLTSGNFDLNPRSVVTIDGQINALENIAIMAGSIINNGEINSGAIFTTESDNGVTTGDMVNINTYDVAAESVIKHGENISGSSKQYSTGRYNSSW